MYFWKKNMRQLFFVSLILFTPVLILSQGSLKQNLEVVQNGYLLVQLFSRERTTEIIRKNQSEAAAQRYQADLLEKNKKLAKAFGEHFTFSKVLFFYSKDKEFVKNKDFDATTFYGFNHEIVNNDTINITQFRIGEVSRVIADSVVHYLPDGEVEKHPSYVFSAFVLMDDQFRQYSKPNWFYVRTHAGAPFFQKKENRLVKAINSKMTRKAK